MLRYESLRQWRNDLAAQRGVEPDVIISNHTLMDIARYNPQTLQKLNQLGVLGDWQRETYGHTLLNVLKTAVV
jgi:ATP-dependent DNA helicase RecQ